MNLWSHHFSQNTNKKLSGFLPCVVRAEILTIFCSYFGRNDDFINSFWNWLTFSKEDCILLTHFAKFYFKQNEIKCVFPFKDFFHEYQKDIFSFVLTKSNIRHQKENWYLKQIAICIAIWVFIVLSYRFIKVRQPRKQIIFWDYLTFRNANVLS